MSTTQFADASLIDSQINHILNRASAGTFSATGDTGPSADKRYSDDAVTESRRKAAYRIFDAIGSNLNHPFWNALSTDVVLAYGDPIPTYYGEIAEPLIVPVEGDAYQIGFPDDPDEIESYLRDSAGSFSDLFGSGAQAPGELSGRGSQRAGRRQGVLSPMALKYSTDGGVMRFIGKSCKVSMILVPDDPAKMADEKMPVTSSDLNVKLALPLLMKEGGSEYRFVVYLAAQGEQELAAIRAGSVQVQPISLAKAVQLAQRTT